MKNKDKSENMRNDIHSLENLIIGFGGCGFNFINEMVTRHEGDTPLVVIKDNSQSLDHNMSKSIRVYNFDAVDSIINQYPTTRICLLIGGLGGNSCMNMPIVAKKIHERGIMAVALVTWPFQFEGLEDKASDTLDALKKCADAVLVFANDVNTNKEASSEPTSTTLTNIFSDMYSCVLALTPEKNRKFCIDVDDLRKFVFGLVIHVEATSHTDIAEAATRATSELKKKITDDLQIGTLYICIIVPADINFADNIESELFVNSIRTIPVQNPLLNIVTDTNVTEPTVILLVSGSNK